MTKFGQGVQECRIELDLICRLLKPHGTPDESRGDLKILGDAIAQRDLARLERFAHDVAVKRDVRRDLQFRHETIEQRVDPRMEQRLDGSLAHSIALVKSD